MRRSAIVDLDFVRRHPGRLGIVMAQPWWMLLSSAVYSGAIVNAIWFAILTSGHAALSTLVRGCVVVLVLVVAHWFALAAFGRTPAPRTRRIVLAVHACAIAVFAGVAAINVRLDPRAAVVSIIVGAIPALAVFGAAIGLAAADLDTLQREGYRASAHEKINLRHV